MADPFRSLRRPSQPIEPDRRFVDDLREQLRRVVLEGADMTSQQENPARAEAHTIGVYLAVTDAREAIQFYVDVFGAVPRMDPIVMDDGRVGHAELAIGDSVLMLAEEFPEIGHVAAPSGGAAIRIEVTDVDATVALATRHGARVDDPARDDGHGKHANICDPYGQRWMIAQAPQRSSAGMPLPRHGNAAYFTFTVPDDEAAKDFYGSVLGWQFNRGGVARAWAAEGPGLPDAGIWGGQAYAGWKMMYAVDDLDAAVARVLSHGGRAAEPTTEPYGRTADCVDNQGVEFWLWQR